MSKSLAKQRYLVDNIQTAHPYTLLSMLYQRLLRDLNDARVGLESKDFSKVNISLCHAQDIVLALHKSLDTSQWEGGPGLSSLYIYIRGRLIDANVRKDHRLIDECRKLIEPLAESWQKAAEVVLNGTAESNGASSTETVA